MLSVCALLPSLTPWGLWENLEWHLFEQLIEDVKALAAEHEKESSNRGRIRN